MKTKIQEEIDRLREQQRLHIKAAEDTKDEWFLSESNLLNAWGADQAAKQLEAFRDDLAAQINAGWVERLRELADELKTEADQSSRPGFSYALYRAAEAVRKICL
jgi:hypothetical protein